MDDVLCAYTPAHHAALQRYPDVPYPQSIPGFYRNLAPIEGAVDAVNGLRQVCELFILSAPSTRNPLSYTEKRIWIEEQFDYPLTEKLILSPDKSLLRGDYLIDDRASGNGQDRFEGALIQFGSEAFPGWAAVLKFLRDRGIG